MDKKYKLIIFDLIDTLANSESISESTKILEQEIGTEIVDFIIGGGKIDTEKTVDDVITRVKNFRNISNEEEQMIRTWIEPSGTFLLSEAIEILKYLKEKSYLLGIISNSPPTTQDQLEDLGISSYFDSAVFSFECGYRKPSREIYDLFLKRFNVSASEALMIGDSMKNDVSGAQNAGLDAILLDKDDVINFSPKIKNLLELKNIL
ncbi:MAG: HAD-IA family hydrolase [Candidatus Nomurabacteria bacterium]|nr:HAD-IA family hydrolase [Candidatus Nomurabacteria bacterium]